LKAPDLLILQVAETAKNARNAELRYTAGTRAGFSRADVDPLLFGGWSARPERIACRSKPNPSIREGHFRLLVEPLNNET
jgi:hypothetical protein